LINGLFDNSIYVILTPAFPSTIRDPEYDAAPQNPRAAVIVQTIIGLIALVASEGGCGLNKNHIGIPRATADAVLSG